MSAPRTLSQKVWDRHLVRTGDRHTDLKSGTDQIMRQLAQLLPKEYQGAYRQD